MPELCSYYVEQSPVKGLGFDERRVARKPLKKVEIENQPLYTSSPRIMVVAPGRCVHEKNRSRGRNCDFPH